MSKQGLSEIVCIIDRSGSMSTIRDDAIGGFNTFLDEQKKIPGDANLTMVLFDDEYILYHDAKPLKDVPNLDTKSYVPRGMTALLDAIGKTIVKVGERLSNTPEDQKPEKVIVAILTDGQENHSSEYKSHSKIMEMINHQRDIYSWEFIFLAANQNAIKEGAALGIKASDSYNFAPTSSGIRTAYSDMSRSIGSYRK